MLYLLAVIALICWALGIAGSLCVSSWFIGQVGLVIGICLLIGGWVRAPRSIQPTFGPQIAMAKVFLLIALVSADVGSATFYSDHKTAIWLAGIFLLGAIWATVVSLITVNRSSI